jgi:hypothetical protein
MDGLGFFGISFWEQQQGASGKGKKTISSRAAA